MPDIVYDCPRCGAKKVTLRYVYHLQVAQHSGWRGAFEVFSVCRNCNNGSILRAVALDANSQKIIDTPKGIDSLGHTLNNLMVFLGYVSAKDRETTPAPAHVPDRIRALFEEGSRSLNADCPNAAGVMYRLCLDLATAELLPPDENAAGVMPNSKERRDLGSRLPWLFKNGLLNPALKDLADCIKEDGNDGAHRGTLQREDALDIQDFTVAVLEQIYTQPGKLALANERRKQRPR